MKALFTRCFICFTVFGFAANAEHIEIDHLLQQVEKTVAGENKLHREREAYFKSQANEQQRLFTEAKSLLAQQNRLSSDLQAQFDANEKELTELESSLLSRQGELGELFGMVRQVAADLTSDLDSSIISAQHPQRAAKLKEFASGDKVISAQELKQLWFLLQQEMTESGKIVRFEKPVMASDQQSGVQQIIRIGTFNLLDQQGNYLRFIPENGQLIKYPKQPAARYLSAAEDFVGSSQGIVAVAVDPTRGGVLNMLMATPGFLERVEQGGIVGYIIIGLAIIGVLLVIYRLFRLLSIGARINWQLKHLHEAKQDNPLGRVLLAAQQHPRSDSEALQLIIDEAVTQEIPHLERAQSFIKLLAGVAPLFGLFGTVTGMIETFQAISLYGTGDPKLMASGISQALVTTMLGLMAAIPLLFLHSLVASRSKALIQILDEQSAGLVVESLEDEAA